MYLYLIPRGGFNDQLNRIEASVEYCKKTKRTLLIDTTKSCYGINFCEYFYLTDLSIPIITDVNIIRSIIANESLSIYPNIFKDRNIATWNFKFTEKGYVEINSNTNMRLPETTCDADIVVHVNCGNSVYVNIFKHLFFKQNLIDHVKREFSKLPKKYLCIQIRNTDRSCDYKQLYETNKELIHSYDAIYIATDDKQSINFFKTKELNIFNFTEFQINRKDNLHYSSIPGDTKIKNLITDIYIIAMADKLLSNSVGGFIELVRNIRKDVPMLLDKFK